MDKIDLEEIKRAINKYESENSRFQSEDYVRVDGSADDQPLSAIKDDKGNKKKGNNGRNDKFKKIAKAIEQNDSPFEVSLTNSEEFRQFESENKSKIHSTYEKICKFSGNIIKVSPGKANREKLQEALNMANLKISPEDSFSFSIIGPIIYMFIGLALSVLLLEGDLFFVSFFLISGIGIMVPLTKMPFMFGNIARLRYSKDIILSIFYIVTYMRQNSNLEKAIEFAGEHISGPLANDFKKILWDVETEKYGSISESLSTYLEKWRKTNIEFLEAMNLIESSLFEPKEESRIGLLDKALDVILTETYEKMLHYTHAIQSPISTLHMLGVILPILGLVIMPLVVVFMGNVRWWNIAIIYNVIIPVSVFFVGKNIMSTRPGSAGGLEIQEDNPLLITLREKRKKILGMKLSPAVVGLSVGIFLVLLGLTPLFLHLALGNDNDIRLFQNDWDPNSGIRVLDYRPSKTLLDNNGDPTYKGPFGLVSSLFSLFIVLGVGLGIGLYYKLKTRDKMIIREQTLKLENGFSSAIFQVGNRLGDGIPLEMTFSKVVDLMKDSEPGRFFSIVDQNIRRLGMSVKEAIFDEKEGAILFFPSNIIKSTMKVLVESIKKGPLIAAKAMTNVARYIKEMHTVEERLKDLLSDVISSMNSLIKFLAPIISGIVVGITSMITTIIGMLSSSLLRVEEGADQAGALSSLTEMFSDGMPTYFFQLVVGIYIVQIVFIVSQTINGVNCGDDKLGEQSTIGTNVISSTLLYVTITTIVMIIFNSIALTVLQGLVQAEI